MEFEKLQEIISTVLPVEAKEIKPETLFIDDLGADSLDIYQIMTEIESEFNIEIPVEKIETIQTVGDAIEQIKKAIS